MQLIIRAKSFSYTI